ncbi:MAG: family 20 glycosylhydrolase, partial [Bacteroidota bacterium]
MIRLFLLFGLISLLMGCAKSPEIPTEPTLIDIQLRSRAEQHRNEGENITRCTFTLVNHSELTLGPANWRLYFSTFPRKILHATHPPLASAEHLSGDWHRIRPGSQFFLAPGDSIEIGYVIQGFLLKASDAALGPYLVLLDKKGEESKILEFSGYQIQPPESYRSQVPQSISRPWPELRYQANLGLTKLERSETLPLIPSPLSLERLGDSCTLDPAWQIAYQSGLSNEADQLKQNLQALLGLDLTIQAGEPKPAKRISLRLDSTLTDESYSLVVHSNQIEIVGGSPAGAFYGIQSLCQLVPLANFQDSDLALRIPTLNLSDGPRFRYRGLHLDLCRNFQPKDEVLRVIDLMSHYKLNRLHLYLAEDEAWRLAIEELPELTGLGSQRGHTLDETSHLHPAYGSGPF